MEKFLGAFSRFMRPKTKRFAVKSTDILEVFILQFFQRKFLAHYHDLCVQKWSCLLLSSDAFSKFSLCEVCEGSFRRIFTTYASKNEAVFCEVQTDFETSLPARFTEKSSCRMRPKTGLFVVKLRRILEVFCFARFMTKVPGVFSRFMCPKTRLFPAKFRRILEVFCVQAL